MNGRQEIHSSQTRLSRTSGLRGFRRILCPLQLFYQGHRRNLRPTTGKMPSEGPPSNSSTWDVVGWFARVAKSGRDEFLKLAVIGKAEGQDTCWRVEIKGF